MQYSIRRVPAPVDAALRARAEAEGKSLNQVAIEALARGAGIDLEPPVRRDLSVVLGTWIEDPAIDAALAEQRLVDAELWG